MSSTQETINFATIGDIYEDGVSLIFDGQDEATEKHYKCNTSVAFSPGDRVKILPDSGTYVVEYVVGAPKQPISGDGLLPQGGSKWQSLIKNSSTDFDVSWGSPAGMVPSGGASGKVLKKSSATDYAMEWGDVDGTMPTGGSAGQVLKKSSSTNFAASWGSVDGTLPTGGSKGQCPVKTSGVNFAVSWGNPDMANGIVNQYNSNASYVIQLKTDVSGNFYIRYGTNGTWKKITVG